MTTPPIILNLGCGTRTSPLCVNIDWSATLRLKQSRLGVALAPYLLKGDRLQRFNGMRGDIVVYDLRRGIPADVSSVDAVYHSHVLEHLDRHLVPGFFSEVLRVLKPGGIHRVVVPDWERACRRYLAHLDDCISGDADHGEHDCHIEQMIEQMVRREAAGTSRQPLLRRRIENVLLGDARRRGETHQWMYDHVSLGHALKRAGFRNISVVDASTSAIPWWSDIDLDRSQGGGEYKRGSLYLEATK